MGNASTKRDIETRVIHAGQQPDPSTGAIMVPIFQSSTFVQSSPGVHQGYDYSRAGNPTRKALEDCLAALEGGTYGLAFASGCAAAAAIFQSLDLGTRVICSDDVYGGTYRMLSKVFAKRGLEIEFVDLTDEKNLSEEQFKGVGLVWLETPSNPLLKVIDIERIASLAKAAGATVVVDNTFMTPIFQQPLSLGADIVVHSTTKYLNGHSDVVGGAVITNSADWNEKLFFLQKSLGAVPGIMDCFLVMRGIKTLAVRMDRHVANAKQVIACLESHSEVEKILYPGLTAHPGHAVMKKQCSGFGGMISFIVSGGVEKARRVLERFQIFALAESLGGVESLVEHPAIMTHASIEPEVRKSLGIDDGLIRLSVGIESATDLVSDLTQALDA